MENIKPFKQKLQYPHYCCICGWQLYTKEIAICALISLTIDLFSTVQRIAWCDNCWIRNFGQQSFLTMKNYDE